LAVTIAKDKKQVPLLATMGTPVIEGENVTKIIKV
jgi:hypothetical protein